MESKNFWCRDHHFLRVFSNSKNTYRNRREPSDHVQVVFSVVYSFQLDSCPQVEAVVASCLLVTF